MKISLFTSEQDAYNKITQYNNLAKHATSSADITLTDIHKHIDQDIWWFNFDDCINNGGLHKTEIATDETNLNIIEFENIEALISAGYLPQKDMV